MNSDIHQVLKDAGVAKGLKMDEIYAMMVLGNDDILSAAKSALQKKTSEGQISEIELQKALNTLTKLSFEYRESQEKTFYEIAKKRDEVLEKEAKNEAEKQKKKKEKTEKINRMLSVFLSQSS